MLVPEEVPRAVPDAGTDYIEQNAASVNEGILLGDIFDFWTYPCGSKPPGFSDIVNANPNILGPNRRLKEIADVVPVTYIKGNYDMNVSRGDIASIGNIRYNDNLRYVKKFPAGRILFTHGSEPYSMPRTGLMT